MPNNGTKHSQNTDMKDKERTFKEMDREYLNSMRGCRGGLIVALWVLAIILTFYFGLHVGTLIAIR